MHSESYKNWGLGSALSLPMWPCKNISHIQVLVTNFFPTLPMKLNLGLQVGDRLLIATHLHPSNYLANQKQGAVSKYDNLAVFLSLFQGSSRTMKMCVLFFRVLGVFQWIHWIRPMNPLQGGERLLIATHLDESNYLANQKQGAASSKYDLTVFLRLFQGSSRTLKMCAIFQGPRSLPVDSLD
jgi:hypothetical protein